ncbi:FAD-dependent oxidoreductase [Coraliomargarita algicola]|uniref:FAD-dependent oxidoreductase n=1 Tax=Coraliomargarita algicola TaxID=3092156 RepID=A0ABZ0REP8_9BACT|nr:FAD-dependent oxidoreductase [Coraliomargarita sp. J2-16]WPJ94634.1 FAD-dependent oxidoreductase [Coraliomargarita sp. J2-16]
MQTTDVLIIGAGISGLLCATELRKAGKTVCVLDKGRGLGGRMATRRMAGARLDHGAQFFTVRDARLQAYVDQWLSAGVIREWYRQVPQQASSDGHPRYCGVNGMTDVPKYLARDLDVHTSQQVIELVRDLDRWIVRSSQGSTYVATQLVITAPLPQALALLDTAGVDFAGAATEPLREVRYQRGLATLAILDGPSGMAGAGAVKIEDAPLCWIADNQLKGISPEVAAVTIHADADFAEAYWDAEDEVRGALMLKAAAPYLHATVVDFSCHRWGFTQPLNPWSEPYFQNAGLQLTLAGDAFGGARVEGAALSGIEAAHAILNKFA